MKHLQVPIYALALGDEMRSLDRFIGLGLVTQEEAQERLSEWQLFYPAGFHRIDELVEARRGQSLPVHRRNVLPWSEAAE